VSDALGLRAEAIPTSLISDVLADYGHREQVISPAVQALTPEIPRRAGRAFTLSGSTATPDDEGPDLLKAAAIDAMQPGDVAVWAGGQVEDVCLFGDLLASAMKIRGVRAAVVDGGFRDVESIDAQTFPVLARYRTPRASTDVWRVRAVGEQVTLRGTLGGAVAVRPADLVVIDANGAVVIPSEAAEQIVSACESHQAKEQAIGDRIASGDSVERLLREYGRI